jgi:hypothetical protein
MKRKIALLVFLMSFLITLLTPGLAKAVDTSGALANYSNPHDICEYFRGIAYTIVRETDNECLASIGEGEFTVFTQAYYSGNEWCAKVINNNQTYESKCIPRKSSTNWKSIYFVVGFMVVLFILIGAINSIGKNKTSAKSSTVGDDLSKARGLGEERGLEGDNTRHSSTTVNSTADEIEKLSNLKEKGIISQREFNIAKNKLLR